MNLARPLPSTLWQLPSSILITLAFCSRSISPAKSASLAARRLRGLARQFSSTPASMAPTSKQFDYIVIGGGSGGSGAARRASGWYKAKTCIIDNGISGGCCVNVGCVPKKMTWNFASINEALKYGKQYCYDIPENIPFDYGKFVEKRDARIKVLNGAYENNWEKEGIELIHGTAKFLNKNELEVDLKDGSGKIRISAPHVCIATGSYPTKPQDIKGAEYGITSDDFFKIKTLPKKMVFVGAGYISVELAGVMNAIGVETHMLIRGETFLRKFDGMIQNSLTKHYEDAGVIIHKHHSGIKEVVQLNAAASESDPSSKQLKIISNDGSELECNELLWAIGRAPEMKDLAVDQTGLQLGKRGHIVVDEFQNTTVPGIYAIGDVTGQAELTPVAIAAGRQLGNRLFGPPHLTNSKLDYNRIPTVIFSHPECGSVGLTEKDAKEQYGADSVKVYQTGFKSMFFDVFDPEEKAKHPTEYKLICEGPEQRICGIHLLGEGVSEAMQGWGVVCKARLPKSALDTTVAIHPTSAEELVTFK